MGNILNVTNAILGATDTATSIYSDYLKREASLVTTQKKFQLQSDINAKLMEISSNGKWDTWNKEIQDFFEKTKGEMSNKDSAYYCENNLQAEMFDNILNDSLVNVSNRVALMAMQRQNEQHLVNNNKAKMNLINSGVVGLDFYYQAQELDKAAEAAGLYTPEEMESARKSNAITAINGEIDKLYKNSVADAIRNDKTPDAFWQDIKSNLNFRGDITDGIDLESVYSKKENAIKQQYNAQIVEIQQKNAKELAMLFQDVKSAESPTEKENAKRRGRDAMARIPKNGLSEEARLSFAVHFAPDFGKDGSGSGSGSGNSNSGKLEDLIKAFPFTAIQQIRNGEFQNFEDAAIIFSSTLKKRFFDESFTESKNMNEQQKTDLWKMQYEGQASKEALENAVLQQISSLYPEVGALINENFKALRNDVKNNPGKYGKAETEDLCDFMTDIVLGATKYTSEKDLLEQFKKHVNDWYISRIKYVELDKKGNLKKTFNANSEKGIADAARFANEHDFVYTRNGEQWAPGKKEALEAAGGVNDVLMSAVKSTLGVPADERLAVKYKLDETHNDMTSTPIFSYKGNDYEVIPNENGKSFSVKNLTTGEVIAGKLVDKNKLKAERDAGKAEAGEKVNAAHQKTVDIRQKRADETNSAIMESKTAPKAMQNAGAVKNEEWENSKDFTARQVYLGDTVTVIDKDAKLVKANKMSEADFMQKYGISYADWIKNKETTYRFNLILNSD